MNQITLPCKISRELKVKVKCNKTIMVKYNPQLIGPLGNILAKSLLKTLHSLLGLRCLKILTALKINNKKPRMIANKNNKWLMIIKVTLKYKNNLKEIHK